jgi:hypothetical protein
MVACSAVVLHAMWHRLASHGPLRPPHCTCPLIPNMAGERRELDPCVDLQACRLLAVACSG